MLWLLVFFLTCCTCAAQSIAVGGIGGGRVTDDVSTFPAPELNRASVESAFMLESRFYDVGTMLEVGVTHGLAVEFDVLYHREGISSAFYHDTIYSVGRERDNIWEFPLLLKYKRRFSVLYPFVEAGVAPRTISGAAVAGSITSLTPPTTPIPTSTLSNSYGPSVGFVVGGGLEFNWGRLGLAPQLRYTHWATTPVSSLFYGLGSTYSSNQNQLDILVGVRWKLR